MVEQGPHLYVAVVQAQIRALLRWSQLVLYSVYRSFLQICTHEFIIKKSSLISALALAEMANLPPWKAPPPKKKCCPTKIQKKRQLTLNMTLQPAERWLESFKTHCLQADNENGMFQQNNTLVADLRPMSVFGIKS